MLEYYDILNCIDELLYEIIDSNHNILYPKDSNEIEYFENIVYDYEPNTIIYYPEKDKWYKYHIKPIEKGNQKYQIKYLLDITELKKEEEKYQIDSLTSVLTRPTLLERLSEELEECNQKSYPFSMIIGDIDYFKDVNDSYGHIAGDLVLKNIGNILLEHISSNSELVGRYGGEEFLFFFKNISLKESINKIIEIKNSLDKLNVLHDNKNISNVTMSFGIYHINDLKNELPFENKTELITTLIKGADIALYKSKEAGRNQTHVYSNNGFIEKIEYK